MFFFKGWQWTKQWVNLLHRALLAWNTWPPLPGSRQRRSDSGTKAGSRVHGVALPGGAGHRPGHRSLSEALGFGHRSDVRNGRKRQRPGLQLALCRQRNGGPACRVSWLFVCPVSELHGCTFNTSPRLYRQVCDFVRDGSRWRWRRKWQSVLQNPGGQHCWSLQSEPQHRWDAA